MTRDEKLKILKDWEISVKAFRQNVGVLSTTIKEEIVDQLYELETAYTDAIGLILGDKNRWLHWYSNEADFGGIMFVAGIPVTETRTQIIEINSIEDILRVIDSEH